MLLAKYNKGMPWRLRVQRGNLLAFNCHMQKYKAKVLMVTLGRRLYQFTVPFTTVYI